MLRKLLFGGLLAMTAGAGFAADNVVGIWKTEPDRKNLITHVQISPCGDKLCGTVLRVFNAKGQPVQVPSLGKQIFWDAEAQGDGRYGNAKIWVPLLDIRARGEMQLSGNRLTVSGRSGPFSGRQTWVKVN